MSCLSGAVLASLASQPVRAHAHVDGCARCRDALDEQRAMRALLGGLSAPVAPDRARVERLAAEVMAQSDQAPVPGARRSARLAIAAVAIAAVAATAVLALGRRRIDPGPRLPTVSVVRTPAPAPEPVPAPALAPAPAPVVVPPVEEPATVDGHARFARRSHHGRDVVTLRDGAITVDARHKRPVEIASGDTRVRIGDAKVAIESHDGVISMVTVIAGTAEISIGGERQVIEAGFVWEPAAAPEEPDTLGGFRAGWTALRAGHLDDAIAAFDGATDPAVAEDAAYWAAVAAERAHRPDDARRRFDDFLARFPGSPRADAARAALARLAAP